MLLFIIMLFIYFVFVCDNVILSNIISYVGDNNQIGTSVNVSGHVHMNDAQAGKSLANHAGIVGGMGVGAAYVGRAVARSPIPPLAKAGIVIVGAAAGGVIEKATNKWDGNIGTSSSTSGTNSTISKLVGDSQVSLLQETLFQLEIVYLGVMYIVFILVVQLIFKLYLNDSVNLNLSRFLGVGFNSKLEYYLNKIILLNKKMSIFWTWFGIIVVTYLINRLIRLNYLMSTKIGDAVNAHLSLHPLKDNLHITDRSIEEMLSYLQWGNYICLVTLICLTIILLYRFHYNKEISSIYIWLLVMLIIVTLAYSAYISGDLYTNVDSYVYTYNSLKD